MRFANIRQNAPFFAVVFAIMLMGIALVVATASLLLR